MAELENDRDFGNTAAEQILNIQRHPKRQNREETG